MCDKDTLTTILNQIAKKAKSDLSNFFISLTLYGSYARGDYDTESDINILILTTLEPEQNKTLSAYKQIKCYIYKLFFYLYALFYYMFCAVFVITKDGQPKLCRPNYML